MGRRRSLSRSSSGSIQAKKRVMDSESPRRVKRSLSHGGSYSRRRTPPSPDRRRKSYESRSPPRYEISGGGRDRSGRGGDERSGGGRDRDRDSGGRRRTTKPPPSRCIGVFGMSIYSTERTIRDIFGKFGAIEHISMITCTHTGRFRGYCFVYYDIMDDAKVAKDQCNGMEIDGRRVRVDYSYTTRAHTPTPGEYRGKPLRRERGRRDFGGRSRYRSRSRSRSPYGGGSRRRYSRSRSR